MALPPGPDLPPIAQGGWYVLRPFDLIDTCIRRYGDLFTLRLFGFGTLVCASHPEAIKEIFTGDPEELRVGEANAPIRPLVGDGSILLLDGPDHLLLRRLIYPLFHGEALKTTTALIGEIAAGALRRWPEGSPIDIYESMQEITLDVILRVLFGALPERERQALREAFATLVNQHASPLAGLLMVPSLRRELGPLTPWSRFRRSIDRIDALVHAQIARHRRERGLARDDILSRLTAAAEEEGHPLSDAALRDHLVTLVMAGHETTAATLTWAFALILGRPEVASRIEDEVRRAAGGGGGPVRNEHLDQLDYLDAAIREVMRLRPVVPILGVGRLLKRPMQLQGYHLPAGVKLVPLIYGTHRRPDLYPDPDRFAPERFLGRKIDPYTWLPFGGGMRRCLGLGFALHEIKIVLATALSSARLRLHGRPALRPTLRGITIGPQGGARMIMERPGSPHRSAAGA
ncbi:cytochrome P450 [Sorangium sp. So ce1153]|uniref:cytochrome P450 n=1 Tax=Sorangium sp. So ce1153 TaxID=3133333 RepID=UPI003F62E3B9